MDSGPLRLIKNVLLGILFLVITIVVGATVAFQIPSVQSYGARKAAVFLSEKLHAHVSVGSVYYVLFNNIIIKDLCVETAPQDTLFSTRKLSLHMGTVNPLRKRIHINKLTLTDGGFHLVIRDSTTNIEALVEGPQPTPSPFDSLSVEERIALRDSTRVPFKWDLRAHKVSLENFQYTMRDVRKEPETRYPGSIDYADMDLQHINIGIRNVVFKDWALHARIDSLSCVDKCGYALRRLQGDVTVDGRAALVKKLVIEDDYSLVKAKHFLMEYLHPKNLGDYIDKVRMELELTNAFLSFRTLQAFGGGIPTDFTLGIYVSGLAQGTVSNLFSDRLDIHSASGLTHLQAGFKVRGLPNVDETTLQVDIARLRSNVGDLSRVLHDISGSNMDELAHNIGPLHPLSFKGRLAGMLTDFAVDGALQSDLGGVDVDVVINNNTDQGGTYFSGKVRTDALDLKALTGNPLLGPVTLYTQARAQLGGKNGSLRAHVDSLTISSFVFNNYPYSGLQLKGGYLDGLIDGRVACSDPNLHFLLQGQVNVNHDKDFTANIFSNIAYANLYQLNLAQADSLTAISGMLSADFTRINTQGDIEGTVNATGLTLYNQKGTHTLQNILLESQRIGNNRFLMQVSSDALWARYEGDYGLLHAVRQVSDAYLARHLPSLFASKTSAPDTMPVSDPSAVFSLEAHFSNTTFLEELLLPGLYIAPNTTLTAFHSDNDSLALVLASDRLGYKANNVKDVHITASGTSNALEAHVACEHAAVGVVLDSVDITLHGANNQIQSLWAYHNVSEYENRAHLEALFQWEPERILCQVPHAQIVLNGKPWQFTTNGVSLGTRCIAVDQLRLAHEDEYLTLNGTVSENPVDTLSFSLNRFDASLLNSFLDDYKFAFSGAFTGKGQITDFYQSRKFFADITGKDLRINDTLAGDLRILSAWDNDKKQLKLGLGTTLPSLHKPLTLAGYYQPADQYLRLTAGFDRFQAALVGPMLSGLVSNVNGYISGNMLLQGTLPDLDLTSDNTSVQDLHFTVDYTRVPYTVNGPVRLTKEGLTLPNNTVTDSFGNVAMAQGGLTYRHFRDIGLDVKLHFTNLHALFTSEADNPDFYGNAFATGNLDITGPLNNIRLDLSVRTEPNTIIHIPLSSGSVAKQSDLLTFVQPQVKQARDPYLNPAQTKPANKTDITFNMKTNITPDAELLVEINKTTGDVISARGRGMVTIGVDPAVNDLSLLGDCTLEQGNYLFVLQGILSKKFQIVPGGVISFNGNLEDTQVNLTASYQTKASLNALLADTSAISNRRNVDCQILMSGKMLNPTLNFNIEIDDIDPTTRARVETALNTSDKMMRQFMTLLISNSFMPDQSSSIANNSNILYANATEILSNQLNNIFSQLNIPLDVGFNYQPGQSTSRDIFDVAISTQLFNNRVVVNGNMGNNPYNTQSNSSVVGNVDIELKLDKKGRFRLKAFSHAADQYSNYLDNTQRNGGGFVYQDEFTTFRQLWQRWLSKKSNKN